MLCKNCEVNDSYFVLVEFCAISIHSYLKECGQTENARLAKAYQNHLRRGELTQAKSIVMNLTLIGLQILP